MTYGHLHRFFLRSVASRGVLSVDEAEEIIINKSDTETSLTELVKEINKELRPFQQTIKVTNDELTNAEVVIFLSLGYDDATKAQNMFTATELEYFRLLIEEIMTTESRQITSIHAMNIVGRMKASFTKTDAQKLLNTWCRMHYLASDQNNFALGIRAIHEFESYLRQNMPDSIEECYLCKQIVFRGYNCPGCALAVHTRCLNKYLEEIQKWPCCKIDFDSTQLERLNCERLTQTQMEQTHVLEPNTIAEATQDVTENVDLTQELIPEISQRVTRKRKRQIE